MQQFLDGQHDRSLLLGGGWGKAAPDGQASEACVTAAMPRHATNRGIV